MLGQSPAVVWLTGLSGSGKSTIAYAAEKLLFGAGKLAYVLDGDNLRHNLNGDLGFSAADRAENIRRAAAVAALFADAGLLVLVSLISPYREDREKARRAAGEDRFLEVFVDVPLAECERRDAKGLYARARRGEIPDFTGISAPYEAPINAALTLSADMTIDDSAARVVALLASRGFLEARA